MEFARSIDLRDARRTPSSVTDFLRVIADFSPGGTPSRTSGAGGGPANYSPIKAFALSVAVMPQSGGGSLAQPGIPAAGGHPQAPA